jgi:hypothetical protein
LIGAGRRQAQGFLPGFDRGGVLDGCRKPQAKPIPWRMELRDPAQYLMPVFDH